MYLYFLHILHLQADFGSIRFPANLMIPAPVSIGDFMNTDHEVAGTVTILDHKRFRIDMFSYDGEAPGIYCLQLK